MEIRIVIKLIIYSQIRPSKLYVAPPPKQFFGYAPVMKAQRGAILLNLLRILL